MPGSSTAAIAVRMSTFDVGRPSMIPTADHESSDGHSADTFSDAQLAEIRKPVEELVFSDVFSAVNEAMDELRTAYEAHLEQTAQKTLADYIEAGIGELITTDCLLTLLNNELLHRHVQEPAIEIVVNRQLHIGLASSTISDKLSTFIADLARTEDGLNLFTYIITAYLRHGRKLFTTHVRHSRKHISGHCGLK